MALPRPIMVHLVWGGEITFQQGCLISDNTSFQNGFPLFQKIDFATFVDTTYRHIGVDRQLFSFKLILWYEFNGIMCRNEISNDNSLETIYFLGQNDSMYHAQIEVQLYRNIPSVQPSFLDQLRNITQSQQIVQHHEAVQYRGDAGPSTSHSISRSIHDDADDVRDEAENSDDVGEEDEEELLTDESRESYSVHEDVSNDSQIDEEVEQTPDETTNSFISRFEFLHHHIETDSRLPFDEDNEPEWDYWSQETGEIRKHMVFKNKSELIFAVRLWNIKNNREMIIQDTRPYYFKARCFTRGEHYDGPSEQYPCTWSVSGSTRNKYHVWRISKWEEAHNCFGNVRGNNNRCLTSSLIATDIDQQVKRNIAYPIKHIQAHIKKSWNVDISYDKAWNARRIAIERLFGTWESNFAALPGYVDELLFTNPDTVVQFFHNPASSGNAVTFKYVFWAFGPSIRAFNLCIPIICVDGTHLKGSYKGKLLTAVAKNANGQILPVAFAMVDEESNESWGWFLHQFRNHVAVHRRRELCVISDRHHGILNAMAEMDDWHHRYCLRHVRSNFMKVFKDHELRKWCWVLGETPEYCTFLKALRKIKSIDPEAWRWLKAVDTKKWTVYKDPGHCRWGNTTTNIAESLNNVLRDSRMMPIKACMEYTFDYTRLHFIKQYQDAMSWTAPLSRRMWRIYECRERVASSHRVDVYDLEEAVYKVLSMRERKADGGNDYTVKFVEKRCTCGKWQNQRIPCSHAIAVCGNREVDAMVMVNKNYTTERWRHQYSGTLTPLRDVVYWGEPTWAIQADASRMIKHRGRRQSRRIRNEMDDPANRTRQPPKCRICDGIGHNRSTCPNRG